MISLGEIQMVTIAYIVIFLIVTIATSLGLIPPPEDPDAPDPNEDDPHHED